MPSEISSRRRVVVLGTEPERVIALRYLAAEPRLCGVVPPTDHASKSPDASSVETTPSEDVWAALVIGTDTPIDDLQRRYPRLRIQATAEEIDASAPRARAALVADCAIARLMLLSRRVLDADALIRRGGWRPADVSPALHGSTVAVVGSGAAADHTARRLQALACFVMTFDSQDAWEEMSVETDWLILLPGTLPYRAQEVGTGGPLVVDVTNEPPRPHGNAPSPTYVIESAIRRAIRALAAAAAQE